MKLYRLGWMSYILAHVFDILTSLVSNHVPGVAEANELMASADGQFMWKPGVAIKLVYTLMAILPVSYVLKRTLGAWAAVLFLLYVSYPIFLVAAGNAALALGWYFHR